MLFKKEHYHKLKTQKSHKIIIKIVACLSVLTLSTGIACEFGPKVYAYKMDEVNVSDLKDNNMVFTAQISDKKLSKSVLSDMDKEDNLSLVNNNFIPITIDATGLYVDGKLIGAVQNEKELPKMIDSLIKSESEDGAVANFISEIRFIPGKYGLDNILSNSKMMEVINSNVLSKIIYMVQPNDTLKSISDNYSISEDQIKKENPEVNFANINLGTKINLTVCEPLIKIKVEKKIERTETINYSVEQQESNDLYEDTSQVTTEGKNGKMKIEEVVTAVGSKIINSKELSRQVLTQPVNEQITVGTKQIGNPTGTFEWPTPTMSQITTGFEYRWGKFHPGIDISSSNAYGQAIIAADGGTVIKAEDSNDGYGNCVIIDHGNGYKTLYGHASALNVSAGDKVNKGDVIAYVGSTGYSTGPHLHFEIWQNETKVNPLNFVNQI